MDIFQMPAEYASMQSLSNTTDSISTNEPPRRMINSNFSFYLSDSLYVAMEIINDLRKFLSHTLLVSLLFVLGLFIFLVGMFSVQSCPVVYFLIPLWLIVAGTECMLCSVLILMGRGLRSMRRKVPMHISALRFSVCTIGLAWLPVGALLMCVASQRVTFAKSNQRNYCDPLTFMTAFVFVGTIYFALFVLFGFVLILMCYCICSLSKAAAKRVDGQRQRVVKDDVQSFKEVLDKKDTTV